MNQRGFLPMGLLASPTLWLGIGCALLAFTTWASYNRWQAAVEREAKVRGEFDGFVAAVKARGEEQEREAEARNVKNRKVLAEQKGTYEKRLAVLRSERDAAQRVLDHYASSGGGEVPRDSTAASPPGQGSADSVPRAALEQLARDAQETTLMFMECRDGWKKMAGR